MPVETPVAEPQSTDTSAAALSNTPNSVADELYGMVDDEPQMADVDDDGAGSEEALSDGVDAGASEPPAKQVAKKPIADAPAASVKAEESGSDAKVKSEAAIDADPFDAEILAEAERYNFTADEARAFGEPNSLRRAMTAMDRKASKILRDELSQQSTDAGQASGPEAGNDSAAKSSAKPAAISEIPGELKVELDPDVFDADTIKTVKSIVEYSNNLNTLVRQQHQQLAELRANVSQFTGRSAAHEAARTAEEAVRFNTEMDSFFNGLGEEFKETFGAGDYGSQRQTAPEFQSRMALVEEMRVLAHADYRLGRPPASVAGLQQRALRVLHGDKLKTTARKEIVSKVAANRQTSIDRPTGRNNKPKDPDAAAGQFARNFLKERGADVEDAAPDEI